MSEAVHLFLGNGAYGKADALLQRNHEYMILFKDVADSLGIGDRNRDEETGDVRNELHSFFPCFFYENSGSFLDELVVLGSFSVELFDLFRILADADHCMLSCTVAVGPCSTAAVLVDIDVFLDDVFVRGNADHSAHALAVHREALGKGVCTNDEDVLRESAEYLEEFTAFFLFAAVVEVCNVSNQDGILCFILGCFLEDIDSRLPFSHGHAVAGR